MLKLVANPTFHARVAVPTPGGPVEIKVEFKHKTKSQYDALIQEWTETGRKYDAAVMDIAVGWSGIDAEFNAENIVEFGQQYHAGPRAIVEAYVESLTQAKSGN